MTSDFDRGARDARPEAGTSGSTGAGGTAGSSFHDDKDRVGASVRHEADAARDAASGLGAKVREGASSLAEDAKSRAQEQVESGKAAVASGLGDFADAVRKASSELGEKDQSLAAGLMRQVASGLEQASNAVDGRSIEDLTRSVTGFARRQPAAFLAGAALVGIALGRVARASGDHGRSTSSYRGTRDWDRPSDDLAGSVSPASRWDTGSDISTASTSVPGGPASSPLGGTGVGPTSGSSSAAPSQLYGDTPRNQPGGTTPSTDTTKPASAVLGSGSGSFPPKDDTNVR